MAKKKKKKEAPLIGFGAHLARLRGRMTFGQVLIALNGLHIKSSKAALSRYESGERAAPDPLVLWGLAQIYKTDVERLILVLHANLRARAEGQSFELSDAEELLHKLPLHREPREAHGADADLAWQRVAELSTELLKVSRAHSTPDIAGEVDKTRGKKPR